ncbi:protein kinase [Actinoplanes oblitus]|uniref:Protein kinase n=1 Tax=Actinoplanes oblitus TaxID=3040509 RepID=A0ABY8W674_9ACTN|nr:serine/threonine-protein kinase [Actinoplanes oblitus]WIM93310.1 protein kinase [Actinoplanes oblitus]
MARKDSGGASTPRAEPVGVGDPQRVGAYRIIGRLGAGGMGTVYLAESGQGRLVAVKVVRPALASDEVFRRRFRTEVQRARQVPPFCTAEVLDADPDHEPPYLVIEYVDGPSLADVVRRHGPLTSANLHGVAIGVATALTAIHAAGVIHRDLKPANVLLPPGTPKVIDFGIARAMQASTQHTLTDQMVGTVAYMAPERFENAPGESLTAAADIFAWGAVVAYAGTGRSPFDGGTPLATATRIMTGPPDLTGLDRPLRELVEAALQKRAADRPDARQLLDLLLSIATVAESAMVAQPALRDAAQEVQTTCTDVLPPVISPRPVADPGPAPASRHRRGKLLAALLAAVVGMAALGFTLRARLDDRTAATALSPSPGASASPLPPRPSGPISTASGGAASAPPSARPFRFAPDAAVADPLTRPKMIPTRSDGRTSCRYAGALVVTVQREGTFECGWTPQAFAGAHRISVEVVLRTAGSCAAVHFLDTGPGAYGVNVCAHGYVFSWYEGDSVEELGTYLLPERTRLGEPHRLAVEIQGDTATLFQDAHEVTVVDLSKGVPPGGGNVVIGGFGDAAGGEAPYQVALRNLEIIRVR